MLYEPDHILQREDIDARGEEQLLYVVAAYAESTLRDDAGVGFAVGDADGFAAVFGVVELFDGGEASVHVHERNEAGPGCVVVQHGTTEFT